MPTTVTIRNLTGWPNIRPGESVLLWAKPVTPDPVLARYWVLNGVPHPFPPGRGLFLRTGALGPPVAFKYRIVTTMGTFDSNVITITRDAGEEGIVDYIQAGHVVETKLYCQDSEQASTSIFHWICNSVTGSGAPVTAMAEDMKNLFATDMLGTLSSHAFFLGASAQIVGNPMVQSRKQVYLSTLSGAPGTAGAAGLPRQVCGLIRWVASTAIGRHSRGRMYVPFPGDSMSQANGQPTAAFINASSIYAADLLLSRAVGTAPNQSTMRLGLLCRAPRAFSTVDSFAVPQKWATQRRRGSYGKAEATPFS